MVKVVVQRGDENVTLEATLPGDDSRVRGTYRLSEQSWRAAEPAAIWLPAGDPARHGAAADRLRRAGGRSGRQVVGFNIARAGRTESFLIPTGAVHTVLGELMTRGQAEIKKRQEQEQVKVKTETKDPAAEVSSANEPAATAAARAESAGAESQTPQSKAAAIDSAPEPVPASKAAEAYASEGYKLVWSDEFDANGRPDPSKWTYERGFVRNEELQWYRPDNCAVRRRPAGDRGAATNAYRIPTIRRTATAGRRSASLPSTPPRAC